MCIRDSCYGLCALVAGLFHDSGRGWFSVCALGGGPVSYTHLITERMQQMEQLLRQGITEDELKGWFAVCEKIRSNLEQYQCNMCREGQK